MSQLFIQLIADYGVGDPSFGEVVQKLLSHEFSAWKEFGKPEIEEEFGYKKI